MGEFDDIANGLHEFLYLAFGYDQRRGCLQDCEVISANLSQDAVIAEQAHHDDLAEESRMDLHEGLVGYAESQLMWRAEFDTGEHTFAANCLHHFVA